MDPMVNFMASLTQWHWFSLAVLLVIADLTLGASFFLLWLGVSAATVGGILWLYPNFSWEYQILFFSLESIACVLFWKLRLKNNLAASDQPLLNRRNKQYIGRIVELQEPIVNQRGKIRLDDSFWKVEGPDVPAGTSVKVIDADGVLLKVEPVEPT